jgi:ornithine cyclodeaminase/alanine dehydrogenase-like protein (mu-crystallin family)
VSASRERAKLFLSEADLHGVIPIKVANDAVRNAFQDWSGDDGLNAMRQRMHAPSGMRVTTHPGISPSHEAGGVLVHCELVNAASDVQVYENMAPPVTVLYNSVDGDLDAVLVGALSCAELPELHSFTSVRTAATSALGTFAMAREDSKVLGIFGTGDQARTHLLSFLAERSFDRVVVYSRDAENRKRFAVEMGALVDVEITAADDSRTVVSESDIILTATNSNIAVFDGTALRPGQHVTSIVGSNMGLVKSGQVRTQRRELDDATLLGANRIGLVSKAQAIHDRQGDIFAQVESGQLSWDRIVELTELVSGTPGRHNRDEITVFKNNGGMGIADVAVAAAAYRAAAEKGLGRDLFSVW